MTLSEGFRLVPLDCPSCGAQLAAEGQDVVFYCQACRNGYRVRAAEGNLEEVAVSFIAVPERARATYRPFWMLPARVTIHARQAAGGGLSGLLRFFIGGQESYPAHGEGTFAVPAFEAPLAAVTTLTRKYTESLPALGQRLGERLTGGCYGVSDAQKLARWALIMAEVGKPDTLRSLEYEIEFGSPKLLGVPFQKRGDKFVDSIFEITL